MTDWPDFFVVGAPRCGTTSLYYYLKGHPDIFMPSSKEPHYFANVEVIKAVAEARGLPPPAGMVQKEDDYLRLFRDAKSGQVTGEASVAYLSNQGSAQRIKEKNADARIIAILRQPIDRAFSHFLLGLDHKKGLEASFYEALRNERSYRAEYSADWAVYISGGLYYEQIKRYLDTFGADQVRIYLYEDLVADTASLVEDVCSFLDVPYYDGRFFNADRKYNEYGALPSALSKTIGLSGIARSLFKAVVPVHLQTPIRDRLFNHVQPKPELDPNARDFLRSIYHDDIINLQELIGRDLSGWLVK